MSDTIRLTLNKNICCHVRSVLIFTLLYVTSGFKSTNNRGPDNSGLRYYKHDTFKVGRWFAFIIISVRIVDDSSSRFVYNCILQGGHFTLFTLYNQLQKFKKRIKISFVSLDFEMHVCIIGKKYRNKTFMLIIGIVFQSIYMYICEYIKTNLCQLSASVAQKNEGHTYFLEVKVIKKNQYTYKFVNGSVWGCQGNGGQISVILY